MTHEMKREDGFTLVELSIVLVIIGLIIGGILAGQDMIRAAEVRATISQVEKYNTAVNTFRDKYRYIPGDINSTKAAEFGMTVRDATVVGQGDGNTRLEGCSAGATVYGCETALFWRDLAQVNLVGEDMNYATNALGGGGAVDADTLFQFVPEAKLGRGNSFTVFSDSGINYYQLTGMTAISAAGVYSLTNALTPLESNNIDAKIDDGRPVTGVVRAMQDPAVLNTDSVAVAAPGTPGDCTLTGTPNTYSMLNEDTSNTPACQLRFRFN